jgi:hypothetical protein
MRFFSGEQVLEDDFSADGDKDEAAGGFDFTFEEMAEFFSDKDAEVRQNEGYGADD